MAKQKYVSSTGVPLTKEQIERRQRKERRRMLKDRHDAAVSNMRDYDAFRSGAYTDEATEAIDSRFISDVQNVKFCRKPVGFFMSLIFLIAIALIALPIVLPLLKQDIDIVNQYTALFVESEPAPAEETPAEGQEEQKEEEQTPASAADLFARPANADEETTDATTQDSTEAGATETSESDATYYSLADPVFGFISYILGLFNVDFSMMETPWYDAQIAKVETGMTDTIAPWAIRAFPAAIILYFIFALALFIKTFICWASGDRRIYRHTGIECLIMILLAAIVAFGGYATTVGLTDKLEFGGIVNYFIGLFNNAGGFTIGYGMIIMVGLPLIGLILSFFLLEKKLRNRDMMQPIIMYNK